MAEKSVSINNQSELQALAKRLRVRHDWHEPDEQDLTAEIIGHSFDNAMGTRSDGGELIVILKKDDREVGRVNLATLFAFACGTWLGYEDEKRLQRSKPKSDARDIDENPAIKVQCRCVEGHGYTLDCVIPGYFSSDQDFCRVEGCGAVITSRGYIRGSREVPRG